MVCMNRIGRKNLKKKRNNGRREEKRGPGNMERRITGPPLVVFTSKAKKKNEKSVSTFSPAFWLIISLKNEKK